MERIIKGFAILVFDNLFKAVCIMLLLIFYSINGCNYIGGNNETKIAIEKKRVPLQMTISTFCDDELLSGEDLFVCPEGTLLAGQNNWEWIEIEAPTTIDISDSCPEIPLDDLICGELYEYELIVQNCNCGDCEVSTIISFILPCDCPEITVDAGMDQTICIGESVTLGGMPTASGGTPAFQYTWSNGGATILSMQSNPIVSPTITTTYTVNILDECGAVGSDDITITVLDIPMLSATKTPDLCITAGCEGSIDLTINPMPDPPYDIQWDNGSTDEDLTGLCAGSYTAIVTSANGCTNEITVDVQTEPSPGCSITGVNNTDCANPNGSVTVTVSGGVPGYSYLWNTGATTPTISNLSAGMYSVVVTDASGCQCSASFEIVDECDCVPFMVSATTTNENCGMNNGEILVSSTGCQPSTFTWDPPLLNTANPTNLSAGTYMLTVTSCDGCEEMITVILTEDGIIELDADLTDPDCDTANGEIDLIVSGTGVGPLTYQWDPNGETTEDISGLIHDEIYTVTVTDANGCTAIYSHEFIVDDCDCTEINLSVADITLDFCGQIGFTNLSITGSGNAPYNVQVTEPTGNVTNQTSNGFIALGGYSDAGLYSIIVTDSDGCTQSGSFNLEYSLSCLCPFAFPGDTNGNGIDDTVIPFNSALQCGITCAGLPNVNIVHIDFPIDVLCELELLGYDTYDVCVDGVVTGSGTIPYNIPNLIDYCIQLTACDVEDKEVAIKLMSDCCDEVYEMYTNINCYDDPCIIEITSFPPNEACDEELCFDGTCDEGVWAVWLDNTNGSPLLTGSGMMFCFTPIENGTYYLEYSNGDNSNPCFGADENFATYEFIIEDCCDCTPTNGFSNPPEFIECVNNDNEWQFNTGEILGGDCKISCPENGVAIVIVETTINGVVVYTSNPLTISTDCFAPLLGNQTFEIPYDPNLVGDSYVIETTFTINGEECGSVSGNGIYEACCDPEYGLELVHNGLICNNDGTASMSFDLIFNCDLCDGGDDCDEVFIPDFNINYFNANTVFSTSQVNDFTMNCGDVLSFETNSMDCDDITSGVYETSPSDFIGYELCGDLTPDLLDLTTYNLTQAEIDDCCIVPPCNMEVTIDSPIIDFLNCTDIQNPPDVGVSYSIEIPLSSDCFDCCDASTGVYTLQNISNSVNGQSIPVNNAGSRLVSCTNNSATMFHVVTVPCDLSSIGSVVTFNANIVQTSNTGCDIDIVGSTNVSLTWNIQAFEFNLCCN